MTVVLPLPERGAAIMRARVIGAILAVRTLRLLPRRIDCRLEFGFRPDAEVALCKSQEF